MKRLLLLILLCPLPGWASASKLLGSYGLQIGATTTTAVYAPLCSPGAAAATEAFQQAVFPATGTFGKLYIRQDTDPTTASSKYTYTLKVNGLATAVTCDVLAGATTCSYTAGTTAVTAGQMVSLKAQGVNGGGGAPVQTRFGFIIEFNGTTAGETVLYASTGGAAVTTTYSPVFGTGGPNAVEFYRSVVFPTSGTITSFYANITNVPGAGTSRTATLSCNAGGTCAGGSAISWGAAENGVKSAAQNITITAGDRVSVLWSVSGAPAASGAASVGIVFVPTTAGDYVVPASSGITTLDNGAEAYLAIAGGYNATIGLAQNIGYTDIALKGAYAYLDGGPGVGNSYTFTLAEDGTTNASVPFSIVFDDNTAGPKNATGTYTLKANSLYVTKSVPFSTPTARRVLVSYLAGAPSTGSANKMMLLGVK